MKLETGNWKPRRMPRILVNALEGLWPRLREGYPRLVGPVVDVLARLGVTPNMVSIAGVAISLVAGSFMVSYTRARAEGLGVVCKTGAMQRPERVVLLIAGTVLAPIPVIGLAILKTVLLALALTSGATAIQRILHVRRELAGQSR